MRQLTSIVFLCALSLAACSSDASQADTGPLRVDDAGDPIGRESGTPVLDGGSVYDATKPDHETPPDPCALTGGCPPGTWVNVTPKALIMDSSLPACGNGICNYGVQDVVVDPVRPSDLYAFGCYQGAWKSTDYGQSWAQVDVDNVIEAGRPWTVAIDPNPNRDPKTPPTLWTAAGYSNKDYGVYKSTDGGVHWTQHAIGNAQGGEDLYSLDVDPYDSNHLIAAFHSFGMSESKDGGITWSSITVPDAFGTSVYVFFIDTGNPTTTSSTWLTQASWDKNVNGIWRTENGGQKWNQVVPELEHVHGSAQIFQKGGGVIYAAGAHLSGNSNNIWGSTDYGKTWKAANNNNVSQTMVFATSKFLYASDPYPISVSNLNDPSQWWPQHLQRSAIADGQTWSDWTPTSPSGMNNGAKRAAVTNDGKNSIIISGHWNSGLWRYVEP